MVRRNLRSRTEAGSRLPQTLWVRGLAGCHPPAPPGSPRPSVLRGVGHGSGCWRAASPGLVDDQVAGLAPVGVPVAVVVINAHAHGDGVRRLQSRTMLTARCCFRTGPSSDPPLPVPVGWGLEDTVQVRPRTRAVGCFTSGRTAGPGRARSWVRATAAPPGAVQATTGARRRQPHQRRRPRGAPVTDHRGTYSRQASEPGPSDPPRRESWTVDRSRSVTVGSAGANAVRHRSGKGANTTEALGVVELYENTAVDGSPTTSRHVL